MKNKSYKIVKIGSLAFLVLLLAWYFLWTLPEGGEPPSTYEAFIKGDRVIIGYGCYSEQWRQVEGLYCNDYPELANLDANPEYSDTEKMITRSIQVHNSRISDLTFDRNISFWMVLLLTLTMGVNLVMDLRAKK